MKKRSPTLSERYLQFGHPKKYCRSEREHLQERRIQDCKETFASTAKNHTRQETKIYVKIINWKQQSRTK